MRRKCKLMIDSNTTKRDTSHDQGVSMQTIETTHTLIESVFRWISQLKREHAGFGSLFWPLVLLSPSFNQTQGLQSNSHAICRINSISLPFHLSTIFIAFPSSGTCAFVAAFKSIIDSFTLAHVLTSQC